MMPLEDKKAFDNVFDNQCYDKKGYLDWYGWLPDGTWTNVGKSIYDYHDIKNTGRGAVRLHFRVKYE